MERQAVIDAAKTAGAREVFIVEESMLGDRNKVFQLKKHLGVWLLILAEGLQELQFFLWEI